MTMLMKKTLRTTALTMAVVFSLSGCAFAAPSRGKVNSRSRNAGHKIERQFSRTHNTMHNNRKVVVQPAVTKVVHKTVPIVRNKTVVVHDTPRVIHHYDDRCHDSDNTGTAIAAGLIGLVLGAVISSGSTTCD